MLTRIFATLAVLECPALAAAQDGPKGDAANGHRLFDANGCYSCHGYAGQGSRDGPKLNPVIPYEALLLQVRTPREEMPPFREKILSDQQVADIYAYLASLPKPPDPKTVKLLQEN